MRDRSDRDGARRSGGEFRGGREANSGVGPRVAVPRQGPPPPTSRQRDIYRDRTRDGYRVYAPRGRSYPYTYSPRYSYSPRSYYNVYSFGYGPAGRGYVYFDLHYGSYVWHPRTVVRYYNYGGYDTYGYPTGELRLQVRPREAQVFVDGYYAGTVDDFDGVFQSLRLEEGPYLIEIVLPGYEPLAFDVRILPGEKITYRGQLIPEFP